MIRTRASTDARVQRRTGFTLWELTMVLLIMAIAATLAAPALARFGTEQPPGGADAMLGLLRDTRKAAIQYNTTATLRLDPKSLAFEVDTAGAFGMAALAQGTLDLGMAASIKTDQPRLRFVFEPTGAAFADTAVINGGQIPLIVRVDPWSGVARADSR
ncbi:MAG TPA: prepilin-type N-terminal cleavage/methylation domain-containing protein [Gemmatimonadaceae bacterium]|nr:prepilin-type N-terminal cleavage/methylation domain-containing protein [Gemmatimonadaceae bacterium]